MIEMFKLSHGYYDEASIEDFIKFGVNNAGELRLRGHRYHVNKFRFKKDVRKYSFKCRVTEQWNHLPSVVAESPTLNTFKNRLDKLWERDSVMYNSEINIHEITSKRNTRYEIV